MNRCPDCDVELLTDEQMTCPLCGESGIRPNANPLPVMVNTKLLEQMRDFATQLAEMMPEIAEEIPEYAPDIREHYKFFRDFAENADQQLGEANKKPDK